MLGPSAVRVFGLWLLTVPEFGWCPASRGAEAVRGTSTDGGRPPPDSAGLRRGRRLDALARSLKPGLVVCGNVRQAPGLVRQRGEAAEELAPATVLA